MKYHPNEILRIQAQHMQALDGEDEAWRIDLEDLQLHDVQGAEQLLITAKTDYGRGHMLGRLTWMRELRTLTGLQACAA